MRRSRVVAMPMAVIMVNGSGNDDDGTNGLSPDGCTDAKPSGMTTWSATATPSKPAASAACAMGTNCSAASMMTGSQSFIVASGWGALPWGPDGRPPRPGGRDGRPRGLLLDVRLRQGED